MSKEDLLTILDEAVENGRIKPYLAAYIAAEVLDIDAQSTGYDDQVRLDDERPE